MKITDEERQCIMYGLCTLCILVMGLTILNVMLEYMDTNYILIDDAIIEEVVREYLELPVCRPGIELIYL